MTPRDLAYHGLAIKRHADANAVAQLVGLQTPEVAALLEQAVATGRAVAVRDGYTLAPLARVALAARYGKHFADLRENPVFGDAYERFEVINRGCKQVITDWQTIALRGERVVNDHQDSAYDEGILDRLSRVHEQVTPVLKTFARVLPRLAVYETKLEEALNRAEDGDIEWVSDVRRESYHTVWFELHEDLLRIMGTVRDE